ncbi:MAG: autotransporter-associated beta strand protein, partial [Verrucomicrobiales bacterium]
MKSFLLCMSVIGAFVPGFQSVQATPASNVVSAIETTGMQLLYAVNDDQFDFNDPYLIDNSSSIAPNSFPRVAYFIELGPVGNTQWVWVSLNTFKPDPTLVGVPRAGTGIVENGTRVSNLNIESNHPEVTPGRGLEGIIEFWASDYGPGGGGLFGSDDGLFDWKDSGGTTGGGHGSFQVFAFTNPGLTAAKTLFSITAGSGGGIGDQPTGHPDWTFGPGTGTYQIRNLEIWVGDNLNGLPVINDLDGDLLSYTPGTPAVLLDDVTTVASADDPAPVGPMGFDGGSLSVAITLGGDPADDVLGIAHEGTAAGQIGFASPPNVTFGGTVIGTAAGAPFSSGLVVDFNSSATLPGVSALLGKITYVNNNASTTPTARRIEFVLTDGDAAASPPATVTLQMNVGGSLVSHIWEGDVSDAFNTAGNWNTGVVPDANDTAIFRNQGGGSVDLGGSAFVGMVSFDGTGGFDLQNGTLGINAIQHSGTGNNTISADVFSTGFSGMVSDGVITLTSFANTILGSWNITGGNLSAIVQDAATALDDAEVVLDGGTLEFLPGAVSEVNGLLGQVFLGDSGGDLVIDRIGDGTGSGGLLGKAVTGTITVDGEEVIRYDDDAQFRNGRNNPLAQGFESVGLNQSDLYQVMFSGFITIPDLLGGNAPYDVEFGTARADDPVQIYVDLNGNNLFEASPVDNPPDSGGTPQGERVMSRNCCGDQYTISQVTPGRYRFAIAHSEGFGGSNMEPTIDLIPDAHGRRTIAPGSTDPANRPGLFTIQAFARGNNANSVTVLSPSFIVLGSGLPGETLGHLDLRSDLTVVSIDLGQHLEFSSVTLVSGAFSQMGMANLTLRNVSGSGDLIQNGDGIVFLPTLNTYTGTSLVQAGIVDVSANSGLGDVSQGAVVTDGASLRLSGGVLYNALESLTIEGLGNATSDAALLGLSGNVDWSGPISVIGANTRIRSSQARFRIFGQLNNQAGELEMRSDGTLEIQNGGITGAGDIRQTGGNRVIMFQNADAGTDFTGLLTITEGIWDARGDQSLGDPVAGTVVTDGGRLELHDGRTLGDNITISGTDFNAGAIRNENGTNTLAGSVTLATNALIHVNDISLRIEGGVIGGHDLIKTGPGALDLVLDSSIDTFTLNGGAVYIHTLGGLGDTEVLDVDNGQTLGFDGTLLFAGTTLGLLNMNGGTLASASGETTLDIPINLHYFRPIHFAGDGDLVIPGDIGNGDAPLLPDALDHFGFHINDDNLAMNLDLNGGMFNAGNPAGFTNFYGRTLLIRGPGARGLDFDEDQDWVNTGAINQFDNYSDLIVGHLNVAPGQEGTWDFRMVAVDDPGGIWVDLDQDGTFESSVAGLGSDRGEQLQFGGDGGNKQVSLPNSGKYLVAFTHREGGGGSQLQVEFKSPSMGAPATIKPGDPAQAGLWTPLDIVQPDNGLTKSGDGAVTLLGDNRFNGAATITGGTLFAAHENALGSPSAGTSVNGGTVALSFPGLHTIDEAFAIDGTGANGQLGALVSLLGDHTISSAITLTGGIAGMGAADGARLTLADDLDLDGGRVLFDGAGEVIVNGTVFGSLLPGVIPVLGGITAELELWLDASDVDGNFVADSLTDGSAVSSWIDKSGKQRDFNDLIGDPSYVLSS